MKHTRIIALLLTISIVFALCSCAKKDDEDSASAGDITVNSQQEDEESNQTPPADSGQSNNTDSPQSGNTDTNQTDTDNKKPSEDNNMNTQTPTPNGTDTEQSPSVSVDTERKTYSTQSSIVLGDSASAFYYSGNLSHTAIFEQTTEDFTKKYISELKKEGFKKYTETSFDAGTKKNIFATYQSNDNIVDLGYHSDSKRLYVTYTPKEDGYVLPPTKKPEYKDCGLPTLITQVGAERFHKEAVSMCYIIRAADGSFIVYDSDFGNGMAELIYDILKKQAPDPNNIVISAWFVTHPHLDHVGAFLDFADKYAGDKTITLLQMVYNYSNDTHVGSTVQSLMRKTPIAAKKLNPDVTFVRPHAGNVLYYADLTFRILYTQEEYLAPTNGKIEDSNGASLVTQMETDSGVKILFGGDHPVSGSYQGISFCEGALYNWYGSFIRSDIVTHFHHGFGGGADLEIFKHIKAKILLWPATFYRLKHDSDGTPYADIEFNARNLYFTDPEQAKKNGVKGYYISGDKIHTIDLSNKDLTVTEYKTAKEYLGK